jgi:hypothetical protein
MFRVVDPQNSKKLAVQPVVSWVFVSDDDTAGCDDTGCEASAFRLATNEGSASTSAFPHDDDALALVRVAGAPPVDALGLIVSRANMAAVVAAIYLDDSAQFMAMLLDADLLTQLV